MALAKAQIKSPETVWCTCFSAEFYALKVSRVNLSYVLYKI